LELEDVRGFQVHLVSTGISWPAPNQFVCTLRFFNGVTLGEAVIPERIPYAQEPRKLLVTLSPDEDVQFLEAVSSVKSRAALTCCYAAGWRAPKSAVSWSPTDSARAVILVRHGKGRRRDGHGHLDDT
jgi:integrase/recombinase XerD